MEVSSSAYYGWRSKQGRIPKAEEAEEAEIAKEVKESFYRNRRRYGTRRISQELKERGIEIGRCKVRRLMKEQKLIAIPSKSFKPRTTDSRHGLRISPNLLKEVLNAPKSWGEVIVGDITYLPLINGNWCYLAMFQDKLTRRVVGWEVMERMKSELVVRALKKALRQGLIKDNAIVHTDQGSQYVSKAYRNLLKRCEFRQSMSGRGNCYDNAQAESFFSRFKAELVEGGVFENTEEAKTETFSYIEGYYNRIRIHSSIGYQSPMKYEQELRTKKTKEDKRHFCVL